MTTIGPPEPITPPAGTPVQHGILASLTPVPVLAGERWELGLTWVPDLCGITWGTWVPCPLDDQGDPVTGDNLKSVGSPPGTVVDYQPFQIETSATCQLLDGTIAGLRDLARRRLDQVTDWGLSEEFWGGERVPSNFALVRTPSTAATLGSPSEPAVGGVINPTVVAADEEDQESTVADPVALAAGLDLLVEYLSRCGSAVRGVIHASYGTVMRWARENNLEREGPRLVTKVGGHLVIAHYARPYGPLGRPDREPDADGQWAYASGPVQLRLGDPEIVSEVPRRTRAISGSPAGALLSRLNTVEFQVERTAAVTTDPCCTFAVRLEPLA